MKNKSVLYLVLIAVLVCALSFFVGFYINTQNSNNTNNSNDETIVIDGSGQTFFPDKGDGTGGFVDNDDIVGENYILNANNSTVDNLKYIKENGSTDGSFMGALFVNSPGSLHILNAFTTTNIGADSFLTVERFGNDLGFSKLVYMKFSTYLASYTSEGELIKVEPCAVVYGFEETSDYDYILRYAFCTYGDRGQVVDANFSLYPLFPADSSNYLYSSRVPYLLTSDYSSVNKLFNKEGLVLEGTTYKLLNNSEDQIYVETDTLSTISALLKTVLNQYMSASSNYEHKTNLELSRYFKIDSDVQIDNIISSMTFRKDIISREDIKGTNGFGEKQAVCYFDINEHPSDDYSYVGLPIFDMFNNEKSVYKLPLLNIAV